MAGSRPLVLRNARIITLDPRPPAAAALAVRDGRIVAAGSDAEVRLAAGPSWDEFDCDGNVVAPAFIDAHIHLLSFAASLSAVDCRPAVVPDIPTLLAAIRARAIDTPPGAWIRATGYRETELRERRHPTRWELDAAAPEHPARLTHGSGHGSVLNSMALHATAITDDTDEPDGTFISRRLSDGQIDGLLLELDDLLDARIPRSPWAELRASVGEACRRLLAAGITSVQDLGARNGLDTLHTFARLREAGVLTVDVVPALGISAFLDTAGRAEQGAPWSGLVKLVITELDGVPSPDEAKLAEVLTRVHDFGARACIHAVSADACRVAAGAFEQVLGAARTGHRHRLEHAAVCPPDVASRLARAGVTVVANPGFLYADGDRYLREVPAADQPYLHNPAALRAAGARVAFGSDAPVSEPLPLRAIEGAVHRRSATGTRLPGPLMSRMDAFAAHTCEAAWAGSVDRVRGCLAAGLAADLVILPGDYLDSDYAAQTSGAVDRPLRVMKEGVWVQGP